MTTEAWLCAAAAVALLAFAFGMYAGGRATNDAWLTHAGDRGFGLNAHYHDGKFYYVIPEDEFCRDYQLKPPAALMGDDP